MIVNLTGKLSEPETFKNDAARGPTKDFILNSSPLSMKINRAEFHILSHKRLGQYVEVEIAVCGRHSAYTFH